MADFKSIQGMAAMLPSGRNECWSWKHRLILTMVPDNNCGLIPHMGTFYSMRLLSIKKDNLSHAEYMGCGEEIKPD